MFSKASDQTSIFEPLYCLPEHKQELLTQTWGWKFRERCLPLIDEDVFAPCYCSDNGRPNTPVRLIVGLLAIKDIFNYTDAEVLEMAEFDLRAKTALGLTLEDAIPCQKTLHNFRVRLMKDDRAELLFATTTDRLIEALEISPKLQRLDSTQTCSNIQVLSRLSRFCETYRLLLHRLKRFAPTLLSLVPETVQRRYLRADGTDSSYDDARSTEGRRRLAVCARDGWRLLTALRGHELPPPAAEAYALVERLWNEQCLPLETPASPEPDDDDVAEDRVPTRLREKGEVKAGGLQTPHDPDATYGHKGTGYAVVLCETVGNGDKPELVTYVDVTDAMASDQLQTQPTVDALAQRGLQPETLLGDGSFASTENMLACQEKGTTLIGPVTGGASTAGAPQIYVSCLPEAPPSACSLGVLAMSTECTCTKKHRRYCVTFAADACAGCPQADACPTVLKPDGSRQYRVEELDAVNALRRWRETTGAYKESYRWRSGIEATNSEMKRTHGLDKLRVRGMARVRVAVMLKALACNFKRACRYWQRQAKHSRALLRDILVGKSCFHRSGHVVIGLPILHGVPEALGIVWAQAA